MLHFLLKYRYQENWERELRENYIPLTVDELEKHFSEYETTYKQYEALPFICHQVKKDFNIDISNIPTHLHIIFK